MKSTIILFFLIISANCFAQSFNEKINKEFSFEKKSPDNALIVSNINGSVKVTGYAGDKIVVEVNKTINAKTTERIEKGKQITLGVIDRADSIILYVDGLCQPFGKRENQRHASHGDWGYNWNNRNNCNSCNEEFDYTMHFTIKVPYQTNVVVSTVNDGNVEIENVKGKVIADNINGGIRLENLEREAEASTINGNLDVKYASNPKNACRFYSLNGDINALFQKGLAANLSFESFNGEFYTNIDKIQQLPATLEQNKNGNGIKYKVNGNLYKVGSGGQLLDFETFNGNVYLKEATN